MRPQAWFMSSHPGEEKPVIMISPTIHESDYSDSHQGNGYIQ